MKKELKNAILKLALQNIKKDKKLKIYLNKDNNLTTDKSLFYHGILTKYYADDLERFISDLSDNFKIEEQNQALSQPAVSSSSFDDVKFIDTLFAEYNKSYKETKAGQVFPRWLDDEQLKWVLTVAKNCC